MSKEVLQEALELLAVATFITPKLQAKRTEVINAGLQALERPAQRKPLTLREIGAVCGNFSNKTIQTVRQTEAAHGIKENT